MDKTNKLAKRDRNNKPFEMNKTNKPLGTILIQNLSIKYKKQQKIFI